MDKGLVTKVAADTLGRETVPKNVLQKNTSSKFQSPYSVIHYF